MLELNRAKEGGAVHHHVSVASHVEKHCEEEMSERLSEAKGLSKWQLALAIGLPLAAVVALGGAILAYSGWKRSNRAKPPVEDGEATLNLAPGGGVAGDGRPKASTTQSAASGSNSTVVSLIFFTIQHGAL